MPAEKSRYLRPSVSQTQQPSPWLMMNGGRAYTGSRYCSERSSTSFTWLGNVDDEGSAKWCVGSMYALDGLEGMDAGG
jgi:hypothetical protein